MHKYDNQLEDFFGLGADGNKSDRESIKDVLRRTLSLKSRLRLLPKVLSTTERYVVLGLTVLFCGAILAVPISAYYHSTVVVPADGGHFIEGIVGEPRLVNPLLSQTSDADRDIAALVFSGLYRYNSEGKLTPDLAKSMPEVTSDGLSYSVTLRDNALWHDGVPVTADDVVFTTQVAQNADYGIPSTIRGNWDGVTVERVSDRVVIFRLNKSRYAQFPGNLTLGLLPKHLWADIKPSNFSLSELNLKPIGSGPYRFSSLIKSDLGTIVSYKLSAWEQYYAGRPHINGIEFKLYGSEEQLIEAFNENDIDNFSTISGENVSLLKFKSRVDLKQLKMPRYFALFFNQAQSAALTDKNVRLALNEATDRIKIVNENLGGNAFLINSPMMGGILDINPNVQTYDFDTEQAKAVLKAGGWALNDNGVLIKGKSTLELKITTSTWPELAAVANQVREQWGKIGVKVVVETLPISQLQQVIKERAYQILLFGEILNMDPDPYTLWHSSQRQGPGLNLSLYKNDTADRLLEEARQTLNPLERMQKYDEFQKILIADIPAVFLYSPHYLYGFSRDIHGFSAEIIPTPSDRFADIHNWYIKTSRTFK